MANLIAKNFLKLPIGTYVEVTYGNGAANELVNGIITDNDFSANVEITGNTGETIVLNFSLIMGFRKTKSLDMVLQELPAGSSIRFSYGSEQSREPDQTGVVLDNDHEANVEIRLADGNEMVLNYALIRSLLVIPQKQTVILNQDQASPVPKSIPVPEPITDMRKLPLHLQDTTDFLCASDGKLKEIFTYLPKEDKRKLSAAYDSFKHGVKMNDKSKIAEAANNARQTLFQERNCGCDWSRNAVLFCGYLLRRANIYDHKVLLVGRFFKEAAYACRRSDDPVKTGAYAVAALLEKHVLDMKELAILLAHGVVKTGDVSGLRLLSKRMPEGFEPHLKALIALMFSEKGIQLAADQDTDSALTMLESLCPGQQMAEEVAQWLAPEPAQTVEVVQPPEVKPLTGVISSLSWTNHTGIIAGDDQKSYTFAYSDIVDATLAEKISKCLDTKLNGKLYLVTFEAEDGAAGNIKGDAAIVERARLIAADPRRDDRFETAFELCKAALQTRDVSRALADLIKHAMTLHSSKQQLSYVSEAVSLYEKYSSHYANNAFTMLDMAWCYSFLKKYPQMLEHAEKAMSFEKLEFRQKNAVLCGYLKMVKEYYEYSGDKTLLSKMLEKIDSVKSSYEYVPEVAKTFQQNFLTYRIIAECGLGMLAEAEVDFANLPDAHNLKPEMALLMEKTRKRVAAKAPAAEVPAEQIICVEPAPAQPVEEPEEEEVQEPVVPYQDQEGWAALKTTGQAVIDYALNIGAEGHTGAMLAYLYAGAALNPEIEPVHRMVALAANDPMTAPDYSITALMNALENSDMEYPQLNDCCMAAAFLRASFRSGRGYDYSTQGLRSSISISRYLPALDGVYDTLEAFRKETGHAIDIYADYRNQGVKQLEQELEATVRHADELYTKFVLTPAREGVKFARLLETKKIVFDRNGYLATMLQSILKQDFETMEDAREGFVARFLNGHQQFSAKHISDKVVDEIIVESWELAGKRMQSKKENATLQGDRRNNLRSNITEILRTICQWYALAEQSAGASWRTEQGIHAYRERRPQLLEQLEQLHRECLAQLEDCNDAELKTGLNLLGTTARELSERLDGSWKFEQEKFLYADFLRSNHILLNEDFTPELTSTFCVLPQFNVLARIRRHVQEGQPSFQSCIDRIFSMEKTCNNYGTAKRIVEYLDAIGQGGTVSLPDNAELFANHTEMQTDMRYKNFRESYALACNYGQILKSDVFCCSLEDTVGYWYEFCKQSKNYGFFAAMIEQAEQQIHAGAKVYEAVLENQLQAMVQSNSAYADYEDAIRIQIANQNFTVAEDWMGRLAKGDMSLQVQPRPALEELDRFWDCFPEIYSRVFDTSRCLSSLLGHGLSCGQGQQLIDNWLRNGTAPDVEQIRRLLNLLGWQDVQVQPCSGEGLYQVRRECVGADPLHPIAAFGSQLDTKPMYVACLYGTYDCDRLYEKLRALDAVDGSKIILLDSALGQADRRAMAEKLKKRGNTLRSVNLVIDRVLISYLAGHYDESRIHSILMATSMPFSYCQPYEVESGEPEYKPCGASEAERLLTEPLSYLGFCLPGKVIVSQILATCNYLPDLIRLYAVKLVESVRGADYSGYDSKKTPPYVITNEHIRRVMSDKTFVRQLQDTLAKALNQDEYGYLLTLLISWLQSDVTYENGCTAKEVLFHAQTLSLYPLCTLNEEEIETRLQQLQEQNILRKVCEDSYLLVSKNLRDLLGSEEQIYDKLMERVEAVA